MLAIFAALLVASGAARTFDLYVDATPTRTSTAACMFLIRNPVREGGREITCLTSVQGFPAPGVTIRSRGRETFILRHGTIRTKVAIVMRFARDGLHARQTLRGTVVGGSGVYRGARGTISGAGTVIDRETGLGHVVLTYHLTVHS